MSHGNALGLLLLPLAFSVACSDSPVTDEDSAVPLDSFVPMDTAADSRMADATVDAAVDAGPPPPGNTCEDVIDATSGTVDEDGTLRVFATTIGSRDEIETCDKPVGLEVGDVVVRYSPAARGRLVTRVEYVGAPSRLEFDVRTTCDAPSTSLVCDSCGRACVHGLDDVDVDDTFYVVVTQILSAPSGSGEFEVTFALDEFVASGDVCDPTVDAPTCAPEEHCQDEGGPAPVCGVDSCGDGFVGFGFLECDDGNTVDGDACSSSCGPSMQGAGGERCAEAVELALAPTRIGADLISWGVAGGDFGAGSDENASCAAATGPDVAYMFTLPSRSRVVVSSTGADVLSVYAAGAGCGAELDCSAGDPATRELTLDPLDPGTYLVVLDRTEPTLATGAAYEVSVMATPL